MVKDSDSTEEQLRRRIEELERRLGTRRAPNAMAANHWRPSALTISGLALAAAALLAIAFFAGYLPLQKREALVRAEAAERDKDLPRMEVIRLGTSSPQSSLTLPGTLQAVTEAPILARADGYLKKRYVDIGVRVKAGQPLAEIYAPELDQQTRQAEAAVEQARASLEQAEANLDQGKSNRDLAKVTADRFKVLAAASQQDNDQYQAQLVAQNAHVQALEKAVAAQRSNLAASQANFARLQEIQSFRIVKAPFDGVITLRNVDLGALVTAGSTLLYRIAQPGTLRMYVNVPQNDAHSIPPAAPCWWKWMFPTPKENCSPACTPKRT